MRKNENNPSERRRPTGTRPGQYAEISAGEVSMLLEGITPLRISRRWRPARRRPVKCTLLPASGDAPPLLNWDDPNRSIGRNGDAKGAGAIRVGERAVGDEPHGRHASGPPRRKGYGDLDSDGHCSLRRSRR